MLFAAARIRATTAFFASRLDRGAGNRAIGTEHAAVSLQRPEQFAATLALVVPLARIGWHELGLPMTTFRTGDHGSKFDIVIHHSSSLVPGLRYSCAGQRNYRPGWLHKLRRHAGIVENRVFDQCCEQRVPAEPHQRTPPEPLVPRCHGHSQEWNGHRIWGAGQFLCVANW
jgi:hypothetical protein